MKSPAFLSFLCAAGAAAFLGAASADDSESAAAPASAAHMSIHDTVGRAGMAAVLLPADDHHPNVVLLAGGANFPHAKPGAKTPEERGEKVFYSEVEALQHRGHGQPKPQRVVADLPRPVAYAAFAPTKRGMLVAGGCNAEGHTAKASCVDFVENELRMLTLPDLPRTLAYPAFAVVDNKVYVMGGQERADSTTCLNSCYMLDLNDTNAGWKEMSPMPSARMLAAAGVVDGVVYVMGGCSLAPDAQGNAQRTYLKDVLCYDPGSNTWAKVGTEMPETNVGMANPLPVIGDKLYVVGGDPGNYYRASLEGNAPAEHPGQSKAVYSYTPSTGEWKLVGELPIGVATMPAVVMGSVICTISGETHPGVRTPLIIPIKMN